MVLAEATKTKEGDKLVNKDGEVQWIATKKDPHWDLEREDVDAITALMVTYQDCVEARIKCNGRYEELAKQLQAPEKPTPFLSTTVGHWTIGVTISGVLVGGAILGYNLKR